MMTLSLKMTKLQISGELPGGKLNAYFTSNIFLVEVKLPASRR